MPLSQRQLALSIAACVALQAHAEVPPAPEPSPHGPNSAGEQYVPRVERFDATKPGEHGSIRHHIVVLRDTTPSRDEKVIVVMAEVDHAPAENGAYMRYDSDPVDSGQTLAIPDAYQVTTQLGLHGPGAPSPVPVEFAPSSDGATERTISEKVAVTSASGGSTAFSVGSALLKAGELVNGKLPVNLNESDSRTEEFSVTMTLKDYFTEAALRQQGDAHAATWAFRLARDIASNVWYFYDGSISKNWSMNSERRMTPMMRRAALSVSSVWRVPASYEGPVDIVTRADIVNRVYALREERTETTTDPSGMALTTRVDLGSPYLSRQPVVRLQSRDGTGHCLVQPAADDDAVRLAPCRGGEADAAEQWTFELDKTWRNRASGHCLTADPATGNVVAQPCEGPALTQQWEWRADRLHTLYIEGGSWRLHVRNDGTPNAIFNPAIHQNIPSNVYHPLLRPWSSYPLAPTPGDVIPNLNSISPPVPESYLSFGAVSTAERWQPVLVRTGH